MCGTCGCADTSGHGHHHHDHDHHHHDHHHHHHEDDKVIRMEQAVLAKNDRLAERNRGFFDAQRILALNLMSSPGAGKTALLERMIKELERDAPLAVIEGDQETENDAERIRATGCRAVQINTGAGCHLDAERVGAAMRELEPARGSILFIENVGNLVCPAMFDLGERAKVVVFSVTEGEDKPLKYPHMFRAADVVVLSKTDLVPHLDVDVDRCLANAHKVNPGLQVFPLSVRTGAGLEALYGWIRNERAELEKELSR
ncbi:MAG: hydrogenase nickel incorporation protein HypB [Labilithrix sp.]|nr:hydrogenase nickel incorporation protein HypB [Labilithrix sp.]MCW5815662.1 hydrogenase nickel incorporation protein HypB [Labilithrix sp.]